jgi:hypothetical protein
VVTFIATAFVARDLAVPGAVLCCGDRCFVDSTDVGDIIEESTNDTTAPPEQAEPAKVVGEDHSKTENRPLSYTMNF